MVTIRAKTGKGFLYSSQYPSICSQRQRRSQAFGRDALVPCRYTTERHLSAQDDVYETGQFTSCILSSHFNSAAVLFAPSYDHHQLLPVAFTQLTTTSPAALLSPTLVSVSANFIQTRGNSYGSCRDRPCCFISRRRHCSSTLVCSCLDGASSTVYCCIGCPSYSIANSPEVYWKWSHSIRLKEREGLIKAGQYGSTCKYRTLEMMIQSGMMRDTIC